MTNIYKRYMRIALIALLIACIISIPFMFLKKPPVHNTIADNSLDSQEISSESSEISAVSGTLTSADISDATSLLPPPSAIEKSSSQSVQPQPPPPKSNDGFMNGVWISVFDYNVKGLGENDFRARMAKIFDDCADSLITDVFCHVRPYADSFYPSAIFPMSEYLSGTQGISPGYNPLQIMIEAAHARNLRFHAWINPYRISAKTSDVMQLSDKSPAKIFATDSDSGNDRYAVSWENGIYFNPSYPAVQKLIVDGVREILANFNVDGIHFDDYFYPTGDAKFDENEYETYKASAANPLSLGDWRRANVNSLVSAVYRVVKSKNSVVFGISPSAHISSDKSDTNYCRQYADIPLWMSSPGYIDYIIPQLYFGYEYKADQFKFNNLLNQWSDLPRLKTVDIHIGLAAYKINSNDVNNQEWCLRDDILARQTKDSYDKEMNGVCVFSYQSLASSAALYQRQIENYKKIITSLKD